MKRIAITLLLLSPVGLQASVLDQRYHYDIHIDEGLSRLSVSACFDRRVPDSLHAASTNAAHLLRDAHVIVDGQRQDLSARHYRLPISAQPDDGCVHYAVDLGLASRSRHFGIGVRTGKALVISNQVWLWRPRRLNQHMDIHLQADLPDDFALSVPWPVVGEADDGDPVYALNYPPLGWDASIGFGHFRQVTLESAELRADVALMSGPGELPESPRVERWLQQGLDAAGEIFGGFPVDRAQIIVVPLDTGDRPVAQGRVSRAGGPGFLLGMGTRLPEQAYIADGLAAHEFMHLLHPPVIPRHRWLSEGMASYYQYIGLARAGHLSPEEAWQRLLADMEDGYWDRRFGTLRDITMHMGQKGGADYVYWSGAALMLIADVALRQREDEDISLDHVMAQWARCCFDTRQALDGRDALDRLDEFAGGESVFAPLYDEFVLSTRFPDIEALLDELGLPRLGEDFALDDDAPLADIRRAIMQPRDSRLLGPAKQSEDNGGDES